MKRFVGRTERRVVLAILVTATVPLLAAMWLADISIRNISQAAFQPEFGEHLERALGVYADLVKSMKSSMRHEASAMAAGQELQQATVRAQAELDGEPPDPAAARLGGELERLFATRTHLVSAVIENADGEVLGEHRRPEPVRPERERPFTVQRPLGPGADAPQLTVVFAADRARLDEMEGAQSFAQLYRQLGEEHRTEYLRQPYVRTFAALLGATVLLAVLMGIWVVRPVTRRINRMAAATRPVAEGDLSVRVEAQGRDEIGDLARAFNHMLEALGRSRARIEFLNRIAEWQNMARRLAHEIKNPLTPIQLAVEECHRRYDGSDPRYTELLRTTVDIVIEEVAGLRRLVGEFAEFARLPRAQLESGDLAAYLQEQQRRLERSELPEPDEEATGPTELELCLEPGAMLVAFDREMLYRVLANLVSNAAQALAGEGIGAELGGERPEAGIIRLSATRHGDHCEIAIEDNGPGITAELRPKVFEPYRTTKQDGTGLGLTIVKKIVIDHGGHVEVDESSLGGARFRIRLPLLGTTDSEAAVLQSDRAPLSGKAA